MPEIRVTENFKINLDSIETFLTENHALYAFNNVLDELFDIIIPSLERFPQIGIDFLKRKPLSMLGQLHYDNLSLKCQVAEIREYIFNDYLLLYTRINDIIYLLSIKHHRQLSYDLKTYWRHQIAPETIAQGELVSEE